MTFQQSKSKSFLLSLGATVTSKMPMKKEWTKAGTQEGSYPPHLLMAQFQRIRSLGRKKSIYYYQELKFTAQLKGIVKAILISRLSFQIIFA